MYFGYKVHVLTTVEGAVIAFEITPANIDERVALRDMVEEIHSFYVVFGDKGYVDEKLEEEFKTKGQRLFALKKSNAKNNWSAEDRHFISKHRKRIETVFSQLTEQFNVERVLAKKLNRLSARLLTKMLAVSSRLCK